MKRRPGTRGFALLLVLWTLVPVTVLFLTMTTTARSNSQLTFNLRDAARLQAAADAGVETAIFTLLQPRGSAAPLRLTLGGATVAVRTASLSGLINPNIATPDLLAALMVRLGAERSQALRIASAILDWRTPGDRARPDGAKAPQYQAAGRDYGPPGAPFETLVELGDVLGMTPALLEALLPNLSLFNDRPPDPAEAPPTVRAALADLGIRPQRLVDPGTVFRITADALGSGGARANRVATVRFGPSSNGRPWSILTWEAEIGG